MDSALWTLFVGAVIVILILWIVRSSIKIVQEYERGVPPGDAQRIGATDQVGTKTTFKPDPQIFLIAIRRLGIEAARCIVFEDAPSGVQAARAAGARCVAVTNTVPAEELAGADRICDSLEEIDLNSLRALVD